MFNYGKEININDYAPTDPMSQIPGYGNNQGVNVPSSSTTQQQPALAHTVPPLERSHSQTSHRREEQSGERAQRTESERQTAQMRDAYNRAPPYIPTPINGTSAVTGQPALASRPTSHPSLPQQHNSIEHRQQPRVPPIMIVHGQQQCPPMQQQSPRHPIHQPPLSRRENPSQRGNQGQAIVQQQQLHVQPPGSGHQDEEARKQQVNEFRAAVDKEIAKLSPEDRARMHTFLDFSGGTGIWLRFRGLTIDCIHIYERFMQYGVPICDDLINRLPSNHPARNQNATRQRLQHGQAPRPSVPNADVRSPEQVWKIQQAHQMQFQENMLQHQRLMTQGGGRFRIPGPNVVQQMNQAQGPPQLNMAHGRGPHQQNVPQGRVPTQQTPGRVPMPQNMPHGMQPNLMQNANFQVPPPNAFALQHQMARGAPALMMPGVMQPNQMAPPVHQAIQMMNQRQAFMQEQEHQQHRQYQQGIPPNMQHAFQDLRGGPPPHHNFQHPPNYILAQIQQHQMISQQQNQPFQPPMNVAHATLTADQRPPRSDLTPTPADQVSSDTTGDVADTSEDRKPLVNRTAPPEVPEIDQKPVVQPVQNPLVQTSEASSKPDAKTSSERGQKRKKQRKESIPVITIDDDPPIRIKQEVPDDVVSSSSSAVSTSVKQEPATSSSSEPRNEEPLVSQRVVDEMREQHSSEIATLNEEVRRLKEVLDNQQQTVAALQASAATFSNQSGAVANEQAQVAVTPTATATVTRNNELPAIDDSETRIASDQGEVEVPQRSRSPSSESVVPHKRRIRIVSSDDEEDRDIPGPAPAPVFQDDHDEDVKPETHRRIKQGRRARPKPHTFEENSDDEMPVARNRRKRAAESDDEDYQEEASSAGSENSVSPAPTVSEDSIDDFIVPDDRDSDEESSSSREDRTTRRQTPRREKSRVSGRSTRVSREKSDTPKSRKRPAPSNEGASSSASRTKNVPQTEEQREAEKKLQRMKTKKPWEKREDTRQKKQQEKIKLLELTPIRRTRGRDKQVPKPQSPGTESLEFAISEFTRHYSDQSGSSTQREKSRSSEQRKREEAKRAKPDQPRQGTGTGNSSLQKRQTPSDDHSDSDGVHVPSKRVAHSNSAPGPSKIRPSSRAHRSTLSDVFTQRDKEHKERERKQAEDMDRLRKKKFLTEEEKIQLRAAEKKAAARSQQEGPQKRTERSASASSSSASLKASTSTKRVMIKQEPVEVPERKPDPPKILNPSLGRTFLRLRQQTLTRIFDEILGTNIADPAAEAQKIELELVTQASDENKYKTKVSHRIINIRKGNKSGIIEVNPNAVSHERMLTGHTKENCTVTKGRKSVDFRQLDLDELHQHIVRFKMTMSELTVNAYPLFKPGNREVAIAETTYTANKKMFLGDHETSRTCSRCSKEFRVNPNGTMIPKKDACRYHNRATVCDGKKQTYSKRYNCCNEEVNSSSASLGCKFSDIHVFDQLFKRELGRFVATPKPSSPTDPRSKAAFALDCEMVYTLEGPALARLTMVDMKGTQVLDVFIKPPSTVIDANTEFSGLTLEQVNNAKDTLKSCHQQLFKYVNSETILIGHSLESDLKAMRIVHTSVIDTAVMFAGANNKQALKNLSKKLLQKRIQGDNEDAVGHDSLEDAMTCVNLIFHGLKNPESVPHRKSS